MIQKGINTSVLMALILGPFCLASDFLIHQHYYFKQEYWGVFDNWVHGMIAVIICLPLLKEVTIKHVLAIYFMASLLDLDHFIISFSFSLTKAIAITVRPPTHSITFGIALSLLYYMITKKKVWTYIIFACIVSHVVRDAFGGGTLVLYPLNITQIPKWSYLVTEYVLLGIATKLKIE
jgi:hypothetical protein